MFLNDNLNVSFESFYAQKHAAIVSVIINITFALNFVFFDVQRVKYLL